jgi:outer membrane protein assembly factor BamB
VNPKTLAFLLLGLSPAAAQDPPSWPEFHGTGRENKSRETGLLREWPKDGPRSLWKFSDAGVGYSGVTIAEGLAFTAGDFGDDEFILALDLEGALKWKAPNGRAWKGPQVGARAVPTWNDGLLYQLNAHGLLAAFVAATGKPAWTVDLKERFEARTGTWGFTEHVIVDGDLVLCMPGGSKGRVAALDRKTGATVWVNTEIEDRAAYSSAIVAVHNGVRQFVALAHETVIGVDVRTGKLLWTHKHPSTCDQNVTQPIFHEGAVFVTSGHRGGGRLVRLGSDGRSVKEGWFGTDLDNCHGGVILLDGYLYGSGCRLYKRGLVCVDWATGKTMFNAQEVGKVSISWADGLLYCLGNDATMALVEVTPKAARIVSRFLPPWENKPPCLSHPVICGGRLYIRHLNELMAYDVKVR